MRTALVYIFITWSLNLYCQGTYRTLEVLLDSTRRVKDDSSRAELNKQFYDGLVNYLNSPGFIIDSIRGLKIGQTSSDDNKIIFLNWNIQQNAGQNIYSAIILLPKSNKVIPLPIKPSSERLDDAIVYNLNEWPPALYYKIISPKSKDDNYYTLLGWDRFSRTTARKTIEALVINNDGELSFGKEVFKTKEGPRHRVVIEYASTASLTLQYSKQQVTLSGVRRSESRINDSIIVVDRLEPINQELINQRWAYVPVGNIYDSYIYFKGFWTFVEGIDARNPAVKEVNRTRTEKPELDLFPKR